MTVTVSEPNQKSDHAKKRLKMKPQIAKDRQKRARRIENNKRYKTATKSERRPPVRSVDCQYLRIEDALMESGYYDW